MRKGANGFGGYGAKRTFWVEEKKEAEQKTKAEKLVMSIMLEPGNTFGFIP